MNSALVHYWLTGKRGGEVVLEALGEVIPSADLYAHRIDPKILFGSLTSMPARETFIARLPFATKKFRAYLPLMPLALESLDMSPYELIVSSESGPAKWIIPDPDAFHLCYCHSPLRYIWDQRHIYREGMPAWLGPIYEYAAAGMRARDVQSSCRVDRFVANSNFVARRIEKYYRRDAEVVHPPVNLSDYTPGLPVQDFYLFAGEVRGYKRLDIAAQACERLKRRLIVAGSVTPAIRERFASSYVEFRGRVPDAELRRLMASCRALLFPGVEDFGITPVEVMASGRPVIAFDKGGARDSVRHGTSGILFSAQSAAGLADAMLAFESEDHVFTTSNCLNEAGRFDRSVFLTRMRRLIEDGLGKPLSMPPPALPAEPSPVSLAS